MVASCTAPDIECRSTREGHYYWGSKDTTVSGTPCQSWSASSPHVPDSDFVTDFNFPEGSVAGAFNKCRNPDIGFYDGVWCYTMDPNKRWELCDVPLCPCKDSSIWYYTHYTYDKVMARYGQVTLRETVAAWRKRFVGYIHRLPATRPACLDLEWTQEDDRKRVGRPKRSWQDTLKEDMEEMGVACSEVRETASDRARWRQLVSPDDPLGTGGTKSKSKDAHSGSGSEVPSGVQGRNLGREVWCLLYSHTHTYTHAHLYVRTHGHQLIL